MSSGIDFSKVLDDGRLIGAACVGIACCGFLLAWWAWFWRGRARGRRRCPKCWYDLRGTPGLRCSECGYEARTERRLQRTRRYPRLTLSGLLLIALAASGALGPSIHKNGWLSVVPTTILLWQAPCAPYEPQPLTAVENELARRNAAALMNDWQWKYLLSQKGVFQHRPAWPAGVPLTMQATLPAWCRAAVTVISPTDPNHIQPPVTPMKSPLPIRAGIFDPGERKIRMRLRPELPSPLGRPSALTWISRPECTIDLPVRIVTSIDDAILRVNSAELDQLMRRAIRLQFAHAPRSCGNAIDTIEAALYFDRESDLRLREIASGFEVEVLVEGNVRERASFDPLMFSWPSFRRTPAGGPIASVSAPELLTSPYRKPDWVVRVRTDIGLALQDLRRPMYWAGVADYRVDQLDIPFPNPRLGSY